MSNSKGFDKVSFLQKLKNIKHIEFIIIGIFAIVLIAIFMSTFGGGNSDNKVQVSSQSLEEYGEYLENKLENVIKSIDGAGSVEVMITFNGRVTYEYATEKEEVTTSSTITGGTNSKTTTNEKTIIVTQNGKETPLIVKEIYPDVAGVVVVASGAGNVAVKLNIISAVETLLGVKNGQIQVLTGGQ